MAAKIHIMSKDIEDFIDRFLDTELDESDGEREYDAVIDILERAMGEVQFGENPELGQNVTNFYQKVAVVLAFWLHKKRCRVKDLERKIEQLYDWLKVPQVL